MFKSHLLTAILTSIITCFTVYSLADPVKRLSRNYTQAIVDAHIRLLYRLGHSEAVITALNDRFYNPFTLDEILAKDKQWHNSVELQTQITQNPIAQEMAQLVASTQYSIAEIMLVDLNGALVAAYPTTTDFWQGDEDKFQRAITNSKFYISPAKWDESTQDYSFFVAMAIYRGAEKLGALIAGLNVTEEYMLSMGLERLLELRQQESSTPKETDAIEEKP
ncbi:PDC sensor domain-containing protein [Catenovulum sediminis]|uniref:PDC sensor domain-containing protein n=1 Tax=Catenovulum sediminis TaxID=1740262 RepID=UPI00117F3726|nr:PDC sensor domain-containing protein [Catenovulum sediminis]